MLTFDTVLLPTCSPPRPWVDVITGGYLFSKAEFVRDPYVGVCIFFCQSTSKFWKKSFPPLYRIVRNKTEGADASTETYADEPAVPGVRLLESARLNSMENQ